MLIAQNRPRNIRSKTIGHSHKSFNNQSNMIIVKQINGQKSKIFMENVCHILATDSNSHSTIWLIQEPYLYRGKVPSLPKNFSFFGKPDSRAIIIAPSWLPLIQSNEFAPCKVYKAPFAYSL